MSDDYWQNQGQAASTTAPQGVSQAPAYGAQTTQQIPYQQASAPQAPRHHGKSSGGGAKTFFLGFLGALLACALAFGAMYLVSGKTGVSLGGTTLGATTNTQITAVDSDEDRAVAVADKVLPSIVAIDVYTSSSSYGSMYYYGQQSNSNSSTLTQSSLGSGVIISQDGYILTNYHVVEGAAQVMVTADGEEHEATVVGTDEQSDLAVLKIEATGLTAIEIGDSDSLKSGQWVMTAGSPFGLEQSVATGIISATSRTVTVSDSSDSQYYGSSSSDVTIYSNMIQTDAAINPGNSGGALVDQNGKLIGINSVIESYSGNYSGVGFAIPVNYAINIAQQIIDGKTPTHAQLGVSVTSITSTLAQRYGFDVSYGAYISEVYEGTGAEAAGLQKGDIIIKVDDTTIESATDLIATVRGHAIGDSVSVTYSRDGATATVDVTLGSDE